jgi:hypothetical protein
VQLDPGTTLESEPAVKGCGLGIYGEHQDGTACNDLGARNNSPAVRRPTKAVSQAAQSRTDFSEKSFRRDGVVLAGRSSASVNCANFAGGSSKCFWSAKTISAALHALSTMNRVTFSPLGCQGVGGAGRRVLLVSLLLGRSVRVCAGSRSARHSREIEGFIACFSFQY